MIKKNILHIKEYIFEFCCVGTYDLVELELTEIENIYNALEQENKMLKDKIVNLTK